MKIVLFVLAGIFIGLGVSTLTETTETSPDGFVQYEVYND